MKQKIITIMAVLFLSATLFAQNDLAFSDSEWNYGTVIQGDILAKEIVISNKSNEVLNIEIIPTCDCIYSQPARGAITPGKSLNVNLVFDTTDYVGEVEKIFIINTDKTDSEKIFFFLRGTIISSSVEYGTSQEVDKTAAEINSGKKIELHYYYSAGCSHCLTFLNETIPALEKKLQIDIVIIERDILTPEHFEEFNKKVAALGSKAEAFPALIIGEKVLQGEPDIDSNIEIELHTFISGKGDTLSPETAAADSEVVQDNLAIIPVIFAGLLDGINPCAFSTLIFLLAYLSYVGKRKKDILVIGIFYTVTIFVSYYLIGLGFFRALRLAGSFPIIATIIEILLIAVLVVFAGISFYDYYVIRKGRTKDVILQLPDTFKQRIRKSIKSQAKSAAIILSSIVLGFLVSIFELACTGQIYFPTIAYLIQIKKDMTGYFFLAIYNIGFILPLVIVFFLTYRGLSSEKLTRVFQKHMATVKLITALFFITMAVLVIFL